MELLPYSSDHLAYALKNEYTTEAQIKAKLHFIYLTDYLGDAIGLKAKQIVIEEKYINKDYLSDYSSYYSSCYIPYDKYCKRVHFFSLSFSEAEIKEAIITGDHQHIWGSYLGFIVVKPIPITVIGFTLFKTYPGGDRNFFGTRDCLAHFYGKEIPIKSLAFQEQDSVLSACATSAIWAMLHKAALADHTMLRTPNEITKSAGLTGPDGGRLFPNKHGLSLLQMCQAIVDAGLVTELRQVTAEPTFDLLYVKELVAAYSSIGIPIILVISVMNTPDKRTTKKLSLHAVTVAGYNQPTLPQRKRQVELYIKSESMTKLYVHDDQWGPFAKMEFKPPHITSSWDLLKQGYTNVENVLIPLYPKVRIAYDDVKHIVASIDRLLYHAYPQLQFDYDWEIKLELSETYKKEIRASSLTDNEKFNLLTKSSPKYIWRTTCFYSDTKVADVIFDATDVSANMFAREIVFYEKSVKTYLHDLFNVRDDFRALFRNDKYFDFLKNNVQ